MKIVFCLHGSLTHARTDPPINLRFFCFRAVLARAIPSLRPNSMEQSMFKSVGLFRAMEYLDSLKTPDGRTPVILEWLAQDLCDHKEEVINHLTKMKNFREILISILVLMIKGDKR